MSQVIYNTQSRKKEVFKPEEEGVVKMYVCGPTVYDFLHIGNFRGPVFFNLVRNWFEKTGYEVRYVYNYTDVDDRIIERANKDQVSCNEISERYIREFEQDYKSLKLRPHWKNPKVTDHMEDIVSLVQDLVEQGKAYELNGDVYYSVESFSGYGKLSNKNIDDMISGTRASVEGGKRNPADFALWKKSKDNDPKWESPWGAGRPGWHIECSAMIRALLGESIDIHGGGLDLVFPHHENEVAQSEGCSGKTFVKYWMHNNMLEFGNQKMSKSVGNVKTMRSFLEQYDSEIYKFMILSAHYRSVIDFSDTAIESSLTPLARIYSALALAEKIIKEPVDLVPVPAEFQGVFDKSNEGAVKALDDDFSTPELFARIFELTRAFNAHCRKPGKVNGKMKAVAETYRAWVLEQGQLLSLFQESAAEYLKQLDDMLLERRGLQRSKIEDLVSERREARKEKNFSKSDELRDQLQEMGILLQDSAEGTSWEVQK